LLFRASSSTISPLRSQNLNDNVKKVISILEAEDLIDIYETKKRLWNKNMKKICSSIAPFNFLPLSTQEPNVKKNVNMQKETV
jgi:hypothetical protein